MKSGINTFVRHRPASAKKSSPEKPWTLKLAGPDFIADEDKDEFWLIALYPGWFVHNADRRGWVLRNEG